MNLKAGQLAYVVRQAEVWHGSQCLQVPRLLTIVRVTHLLDSSTWALEEPILVEHTFPCGCPCRFAIDGLDDGLLRPLRNDPDPGIEDPVVRELDCEVLTLP